jgi:hypothetical protein
VREGRAVFLNAGATSHTPAAALELAGVRLCYEAGACAAHLHGFAVLRPPIIHKESAPSGQSNAKRRLHVPVTRARARAGPEVQHEGATPAKRQRLREAAERKDDAGSRPAGGTGGP